MNYQRPEIAILGNAAQVIQADKAGSAESGLEAQQGLSGDEPID